MYLTYEEYKQMGGALDETAFTSCCIDAEMKINSATFNRIKNTNKAIKGCTKKLIDIISNADITNAKISSFSHDGLSQTFSRPSSDEYEREINKTIYDYLINEVSDDGTPLLYCGVSV